MVSRMLGAAFLGCALLMGACEQASHEEWAAADDLGETRAALTSPGTALFVVGATALSAPDTALRNRLVGLGFSVSAVSGPDSRTTDADGKSLVVISESVTSANVGSKFRSVAVPVLSLENAVLDDMGLTGTVAGTDYGEVVGQTDLRLVATSHPMASGATLTVTTSSQVFAFGKPASGAIRIADIVGNSNQAAIFGYDRGQAMVGLAAPARRVGWFAGKTVPSALNAHGWKLFDAAVTWAVAESACSSGQTRSCSAGGKVGSCASGTQTCTTSGTWGACSIAPAPADTCQAGNDANCNGIPNEGCACINGSTRTCGMSVGNCEIGVQTCASGAWGACAGATTPAAKDTCAPGDDANCNGTANEGCSCISGETQSCSAGCGLGLRVCTSAGVWGPCGC